MRYQGRIWDSWVATWATETHLTLTQNKLHLLRQQMYINNFLTDFFSSHVYHHIFFFLFQRASKSLWKACATLMWKKKSLNRHGFQRQWGKKSSFIRSGLTNISGKKYRLNIRFWITKMSLDYKGEQDVNITLKFANFELKKLVTL